MYMPAKISQKNYPVSDRGRQTQTDCSDGVNNGCDRLDTKQTTQDDNAAVKPPRTWIETVTASARVEIELQHRLSATPASVATPCGAVTHQ